ncbi:MAG: hypothetical protein R2715_23535 [Ilumatobacteraceae bacterium]
MRRFLHGAPLLGLSRRLKSETYGNLLGASRPRRSASSRAGMLPKGPLGRQQIKKLKACRPGSSARRPEPHPLVVAAAKAC